MNSTPIIQNAACKSGHPSKVFYTLLEHFPFAGAFFPKDCKVLLGSYEGCPDMSKKR